MRNLTLAVDDALLEKVRAVAVQRGTTVNAIVREHLDQLVRNEDRLAQAKRELRVLSERTEVDLGSDYRFDRNDAYGERDFSRHQHSDLRGFREEE